MLNKSILGVVTALILSVSVAGCAANLCERKNSWMENNCAGTDVTYTPDTLCQHNLDNCSGPKLKIFDAWVNCLESLNECSLEALNKCNQKYPGGMNLQCALRG